jgi:hypothetical protein
VITPIKHWVLRVRSSWLACHILGSKYLNEDAEWSDDGGGGGGLFWDDHDEKTFGSAEFLEDHEDYQEGFLWSCCEQRGDAEGCKAREHDVWVKRANS